MSRVPAPLSKILDLDKALTKKFCEAAASICPQINGSYRTYMKGLEVCQCKCIISID